jgi:hypothetical protein
LLITEYFKEIESHIAHRVYILESNLIRDKRSAHIGIIEGELIFKDESVLNFIEFVNVKKEVHIYKYSYHYRDKNGELIFRYDMAPHHKEIVTFPHHKHIYPDKVIKASVPNLKFVLDEIDNFME